MEGHFNEEHDEPCLSNFLYQYDLCNLVKVDTYFKNLSNCIKTSFGENKLCTLTIKLYRDHKKTSLKAFNEHLQNMVPKNQIKTCK